LIVKKNRTTSRGHDFDAETRTLIPIVRGVREVALLEARKRWLDGFKRPIKNCSL